jgi:hypothetical protein
MKSKLILIILSLLVLLYSCGRRHVPEKTPAPENNNVTIPKTDSVVVKKAPLKPRPKPKDIIPNTIAVNDAAAHKSIDGRLYYDLLGHRYWKNYKDGKYYLFNKSMYSNPAFKAPK